MNRSVSSAPTRPQAEVPADLKDVPDAGDVDIHRALLKHPIPHTHMPANRARSDVRLRVLLTDCRDHTATWVRSPWRGLALATSEEIDERIPVTIGALDTYRPLTKTRG
eukprot:gene16841-biopygen6755